MRVEELHIDGFGRFQNLTVTDLGPGLSIVLGKNEAGKSTLLAFLRSVLFGLPTRKQSEFYPPLNGGRHGGRIVLVDGEAERIVVERFAGKGSGRFTATFPDGSQLGEEQFRQRLGMVTGDVYAKVFAFGLGELQTFETLQDDNIRDAIYNAGMGTGGQSPAQAVKKLSERCERLFKPGGSNPEMNQLLKRLMERRQQIGEHATDQDQYQRIQDELKRTDLESADISSELHRCRQRLARLHTLQQARDDWILLMDAGKQLQSLPQIESFPQDGVSRMDTLLSEQRSLRNQLREVGDGKREAEQELAAIQVDEPLLSLSDDIRGLERRIDLYEENRLQLTTAKAERKLAGEQLNQNLQDLGEEWNEEKLRGFDLSIPASEELDASRQACEEVLKRGEKQTAQVELREKQLQESRENEQSEREELKALAGPTANPDVEGIRRLGRNQTAYEAALRDLPRVKQEYRGNEQRLQETLRSIGPDWTEERLDQFDDSLSARETLNVHRERLNDLRARRSQLTGRMEDARQSVQGHKAAVERDETSLASRSESSGVDETSLNESKNRLRGLRSLLTQHTQLTSEIAHRNERKRDLEEQMSRLEQDVEEATARIPRWLIYGVALLGLLVLLVLGLTRGEWIMGGVVLVVLLTVAVLLHVVQRAAPSATQARRRQRTRDRERIAQRVAEIESSLRESHGKESELRQRIQQQSEAAGINIPLTGSSSVTQVEIGLVDEQEELIERQLYLLQQRRPIEQRLAERRPQLERAKLDLEEAERNEAKTQEKLSQTEAGWRSWLREAVLPETLSPDMAVEVLSRLASARELLKAIGDQRGRIRDMCEEIDGYEESVRSVAANSGIDDLPQETLATVQFLSERLDEHNERLRGIEEASRRVDAAEKRTAQAADRLDEAHQLHDAELARQKSADQQWKELLRRRGLRQTLTIQHAEQMIQGIERARGQLTQLDNHKATETTLSEQTAVFVNRVSSVAQRATLSPPKADEISACVESLATRLKQAEEDHRHRKLLRETMQKSDDSIKRIQAQIDERQNEIDDLFTAAATKDEETFRQRATDYQKHQTLVDETRSLETRLRQLAGSEDGLAALRQELEQSAPEALQTEQQELTEAINDWEQNKEQAVRLSENLRLQLQQLENSDEISSLRIQQQSDLAEFRNHAREWTVLKIAAHLIDLAREKYERERRPAVLKQAERYFTRLTHGRYREILTTEGDPHVVAPDGPRKELRHLSRGTAEQLYLSLRFGFVEEFIQRSEPLPLIFDDILVNFDPERASAAADAIVELSRNQQILLFTCHPTTVHLLKGFAPDAPVFELQDGRLTDETLLQN